MAANYSVLRIAYAVLNGGVPAKGKTERVMLGDREEEEPEALRNLRESVNGSLKRRSEMVQGKREG